MEVWNCITNLKKGSNEADTDDRSVILSQLSKLEDKEARIKQAYRDGIDTLEEYKENKQLLKDERAALEKQLEAFNNTSSTDSNAAMLKSISTVYDIIKDTSNNTLTRANAIRSVVDHMVYDKEMINWKCTSSCKINSKHFTYYIFTKLSNPRICWLFSSIPY